VTEHARYTLPVGPGEDVDAAAARLWAAGAVGVWLHPSSVDGWFTAPTPDVPGGGDWAEEPERDWQAEWKATIGPVHAGRVAIVPTWLADDHIAADAEITLVMDPGQAFGSGHHATTTMCLELLQELALEASDVLDVGCGTGVLAIAAARLGATQVTAVDIDGDAVTVTRRNAEANGVALVAEVGTVTAATPVHDVVVANLVTDTIVALAPALVRVAASHLIVSGIATEREDRAIAALNDNGATITQIRRRDGWTAVHATTLVAG